MFSQAFTVLLVLHVDVFPFQFHFDLKMMMISYGEGGRGSESYDRNYIISENDDNCGPPLSEE